jgi:hypothetical protein
MIAQISHSVCGHESTASLHSAYIFTDQTNTQWIVPLYHNCCFKCKHLNQQQAPQQQQQQQAGLSRELPKQHVSQQHQRQQQQPRPPLTCRPQPTIIAYLNEVELPTDLADDTPRHAFKSTAQTSTGRPAVAMLMPKDKETRGIDSDMFHKLLMENGLDHSNKVNGGVVALPTIRKTSGWSDIEIAHGLPGHMTRLRMEPVIQRLWEHAKRSSYDCLLLADVNPDSTAIHAFTPLLCPPGEGDQMVHIDDRDALMGLLSVNANVPTRLPHTRILTPAEARDQLIEADAEAYDKIVSLWPEVDVDEMLPALMPIASNNAEVDLPLVTHLDGRKAILDYVPAYTHTIIAPNVPHAGSAAARAGDHPPPPPWVDPSKWRCMLFLTYEELADTVPGRFLKQELALPPSVPYKFKHIRSPYPTEQQFTPCAAAATINSSILFLERMCDDCPPGLEPYKFVFTVPAKEAPVGSKRGRGQRRPGDDDDDRFVPDPLLVKWRALPEEDRDTPEGKKIQQAIKRKYFSGLPRGPYDLFVDARDV